MSSTNIQTTMLRTKNGKKFEVERIDEKITLSNSIELYIKHKPEFMLHIIKYELSDKSEQFILMHAHLINKHKSVSRFKYYFNDLLLSDTPAKHINTLFRLGILQHLIPELIECKPIIQQKEYHKFDVYGHCLSTLAHSEPTLVLRMAGLLHDVGKPTSYKKISGKATFHLHNVEGAKIASIILTRLGYSTAFKNKVCALIKNHMYHYTECWTDKAVKRFIKTAGINKNNITDLSNLPLFKLRAADRLGSGVKHTAITEVQKKFEDRIRMVFYKNLEFNF